MANKRTKTAKRAAPSLADDLETLVAKTLSTPAGKPSSLIDTRVIYCGDCLEQLAKLPGECIDLIYIDPPFNSNRNYEVLGARQKRSGPLRTATPAPRRTSTTCGRAAWNWRASSRRPARSTTTATGMHRTTSRL